MSLCGREMSRKVQENWPYTFIKRPQKGLLPLVADLLGLGLIEENTNVDQRAHLDRNLWFSITLSGVSVRLASSSPGPHVLYMM